MAPHIWSRVGGRRKQTSRNGSMKKPSARSGYIKKLLMHKIGWNKVLALLDLHLSRHNNTALDSQTGPDFKHV